MAQSRVDLENKLAALEQKTFAGDPKTVAKLHEQGNLAARERIDKLLDPGTFVEEFMLAETPCTDFGMAERRQPSDGVVTGFGKIDGRLVYVYSQDRSVLAGSVGAAHAEKIAYVIQSARKTGVPVIGLNDSAGARIQEGLSVTSAIGKIFFENSIASGCVPQISAIMGPCIGVGSYSPALTDVILQVQNTSQMFITGPDVVRAATGASGLAAERLFLVGDYSVQAVERFAGHILLDGRLAGVDEAELRALAGDRIVFLGEPDPGGRFFDDRQKFFAERVGGSAAEIIGHRRLAAG
jgi:acetyl-CoA carboxylase carboxyltransferase component